MRHRATLPGRCAGRFPALPPLASQFDIFFYTTTFNATGAHDRLAPHVRRLPLQPITSGPGPIEIEFHARRLAALPTDAAHAVPIQPPRYPHQPMPTEIGPHRKTNQFKPSSVDRRIGARHRPARKCVLKLRKRHGRRQLTRARHPHGNGRLFNCASPSKTSTPNPTAPNGCNRQLTEDIDVSQIPRSKRLSVVNERRVPMLNRRTSQAREASPSRPHRNCLHSLIPKISQKELPRTSRKKPSVGCLHVVSASGKQPVTTSYEVPSTHR